MHVLFVLKLSWMMHVVLDRKSVLVLSGCKVKPHTTLGRPMTTSIVNYSLKSADTLLKIVVVQLSMLKHTEAIYIFCWQNSQRFAVYPHGDMMSICGFRFEW